EGQRKEQEISGRPGRDGPFRGDVRRGFVYRQLPHVKLSDIAQNPDVQAGMSRADLDAAIARHSEHELLFDQPYDDRRTIRVCGPFTVESLSPHRMLSDDEVPDTEDVAESTRDYERTILGNLQ